MLFLVSQEDMDTGAPGRATMYNVNDVHQLHGPIIHVFDGKSSVTYIYIYIIYILIYIYVYNHVCICIYIYMRIPQAV